MSTELEFKRECEGLVREYFTHGVVTDVEDSLKELLGRPGWTEHASVPDRGRSPLASSSPLAPALGAPALGASTLSAASLRAMVVKRAVIAALDRGAREREMAAQLLRALRCAGVVSRAHGEAGFDLLLQALESLTIDVPTAPDDLHVFLARAAVDGVVSDQFLDECADATGLDVEARRVALSARRCGRRAGAFGFWRRGAAPRGARPPRPRARWTRWWRSTWRAATRARLRGGWLRCTSRFTTTSWCGARW